MTTTLKVHMNADGELLDPTLLKSSGNSDFDSAALQCAHGDYTKPVQHDGTPVDVDWALSFHWQPNFPHVTLVPAAPDAASHACNLLLYPPRAIRRHIEGDTTVSYKIGTDGSVQNAVIKSSSGSEDLDQATLNCITGWRYFPAVKDGQPIEMDGEIQYRWRLSR